MGKPGRKTRKSSRANFGRIRIGYGCRKQLGPQEIVIIQIAV